MVWRWLGCVVVCVGMGCQAGQGEVAVMSAQMVESQDEALRERMRSTGNVPQTIEARQELVGRWRVVLGEDGVPWRVVLRESKGCVYREAYAGAFGFVKLDASKIICEDATLDHVAACERAYLESASQALLGSPAEQTRLNAAQHAYMLERFGEWTREASAWRVSGEESFYVYVRYYEKGVEVEHLSGAKEGAPVVMAYQCHLPHGDIFSLTFL